MEASDYLGRAGNFLQYCFIDRAVFLFLETLEIYRLFVGRQVPATLN